MKEKKIDSLRSSTITSVLLQVIRKATFAFGHKIFPVLFEAPVLGSGFK